MLKFNSSGPGGRGGGGEGGWGGGTVTQQNIDNKYNMCINTSSLVS